MSTTGPHDHPSPGNEHPTADSLRPGSQPPSPAGPKSPVSPGSLGNMALPSPPPGENPGDLIGPYRLLSVLGEGGFGMVWLAERREPHVQRVALKIIKPGMDSRAVIARFEQERQALAVMDHPNVAKVFDAGATQHGRPYFVMEHVPGEPITDYCDKHKLTIRQRLELFIPVCEAVQHAHHKGIIHRDIKPSNVLVTLHDGRPAPKVIDFGVAKAILHTLTDKTIFTEQGQILGTPEYMSPEQAEMGAMDIDTRTDVYSLGVLLYQLLTGALPFDSRDLRSKGYREIQRIIREVDPPRPSTRLTSLHAEGEDVPGSGRDRQSNRGISAVEIADRRQTHLDALVKQLRVELEWIPLKAMRKDRTERYRTPQEIADDIANYLHGRPLIAGPESAMYRARKFVRRNRAPVAIVLAFVLLLIAGIVTTTRQTRRAMRAEHVSEVVNRFLHEDLLSPRDSEGENSDLKFIDVLEQAAKSLSDRFKDDPEIESRIQHALGDAYLRMGETERARAFLERARDLYMQNGQGESDAWVNAELDLAETLWRQDQPDAPLKRAKEIIDRLTARRGPTDLKTLDARLQYANALKADDRLDEAAKAYDALIIDRTAALGASDVDTIIARKNRILVDILRGKDAASNGDKTGAMKWWEQSLAAMKSLHDESRKSLGLNDTESLAQASEVASLFNRLDRLDEARLWYQQAIAGMREHLGESHFRTMETQANFGALLKKQAKYEEARPILERVLAQYRISRGKSFGATVTIAGWLAEVCEKSGRLDQARDTLIDMHKDLVEEHAEADDVRAQAVLVQQFFERRGDAAKAREWAARAASQPVP